MPSISLATRRTSETVRSRKSGKKLLHQEVPYSRILYVYPKQDHPDFESFPLYARVEVDKAGAFTAKRGPGFDARSLARGYSRFVCRTLADRERAEARLRRRSWVAYFERKRLPEDD